LDRTICAIIIALLFVSGCVDDRDNIPPEILSIIATPSVVGKGGEVELHCLAIDEDFDNLAFCWHSTAGSFPRGSGGESVVWRAPDLSGTHSVLVSASDGFDSVRDSVYVDVLTEWSPTAAFTVNPIEGYADSVFTLDAGESWDIETPADQLEVRWDWENDGVADTPWTKTKTATHRYTSSGRFLIKLQVRDELGLIDSETCHVFAISSGIMPGEMVEIPAGTFMMGQTGVAYPIHEVTLSHNFLIGRYPITNQEYLEALQWAYDQGRVTVEGCDLRAYGEDLLRLCWNIDYFEILFDEDTQQFNLHEGTWNGYGHSGPGYAYPSGYDVANHPVKWVSWFGAACYCDWLSEIEGRIPFYQGNWDHTDTHNPYNTGSYRLPTEAEWEYAARYNDNRIYPWGDDQPSACYHGNFSSCVDWTTRIGTYPAGISQLGLYDMVGNVKVWVGDKYGIYTSEPQVNPLGPDVGNDRVMRGSGYRGGTHRENAYRYPMYPGYWHSTSIGFRICRTATQ